jgi:type II secretory pathway pseudopilin PulG
MSSKRIRDVGTRLTRFTPAFEFDDCSVRFIEGRHQLGRFSNECMHPRLSGDAAEAQYAAMEQERAEREEQNRQNAYAALNALNTAVQQNAQARGDRYVPPTASTQSFQNNSAYSSATPEDGRYTYDRGLEQCTHIIGDSNGGSIQNACNVPVTVLSFSSDVSVGGEQDISPGGSGFLSAMGIGQHVNVVMATCPKGDYIEVPGRPGIQWSGSGPYLQDFLVEDRPISPVEDHLTGSLAEPKATSLTLPFSCWQVCEL